MLDINDPDLTLFLESIDKIYGYDFSGYAKASMKRRIQRYLTNKGMNSLQELNSYIVNDENAFEGFLREFTINVTEMFRDPSFYSALRHKVFPKLNTYPFLRIWCAGCSSGEEVYSLAILLKEGGLLTRSKIYGTDINQKVLAQAREGVFHLSFMREYTTNYIQSGGNSSFSDYYTANYNLAVFDSSLKQHMIFAAHNLVSDSSFNEFNLIICRNVLIYFNRELQEKVIKLFVESLPVFGYLALGNKETLALSQYYDFFEVIDKKEKIYRKIR